MLAGKSGRTLLRASAPGCACVAPRPVAPRRSIQPARAWPGTRQPEVGSRPAAEKQASAFSSNGNGNGVHGPQGHKVFMFDPANPSEVQELTVQPHEDAAAAEELLQAAQSSGIQTWPLPSTASQPGSPDRSNGNGNWPGLLPLKAMTGRLNGKTVMGGATAIAPAPQQAISNGNGIGNGISNGISNGNGLAKSERNSIAIQKSAEMQKELLNQLTKEQTQVANLRQYESMYREWRVKAERLEGDISMLHRLVAEKDAELAHGYKLLEASAAERSRLRHAYQASQEKAKALQMSLSEAQQRALTAPPPQQLLGSGNGHVHEGMNGTHRANGNSWSMRQNSDAVPGVMTTKIQELSLLAQGLATDMQAEVRSKRSGSPGASKH